jgi:hypothetical protein
MVEHQHLETNQLYHYARCEALIKNKPTFQRYPSFLMSESESILMKETEEIFETLVDHLRRF